MNNTKEKQARNQIIISVLVFTVILFAEMYLMINFNQSYFPIIILAIIALVAVYVLVNALMTWNEVKEAKREEHLENIYKSEKASYIMLKKSFDEIEERLDMLKEISKIPAEEIINAQKGIAKVIINRNKENAELKLQDFLEQLKDTEIRLNQAIMNGAKVVVPDSAPSYELPVENVENSIFEEESVLEEIPVEEEKTSMSDLSDPNKAMSPDEIAALFANMTPSEPVPVEEPLLKEIPVEEEKTSMPDLSDPNKVMSPDEIAALIANL